MVCRYFLKLVRFSLILSLIAAFCQPVLALQEEDDEPAFGGIEINADGILSRRSVIDQSKGLDRQRWAAAKASLNQDLQKQSKLRCVSLTRLEQEVKALVEAGKPIPDEMKYLAGLTKVTHVFYYPETRDVVIAGPAEGFFETTSRHVIGTVTGSSTLQLQDLIVALRAFGPDNQSTRVISCSIDPTQEGLVRFKEAVAYVKNAYANSGGIGPADVAKIIQVYRNALGLQEITVKGVSNKTNFARVMVEADYRMKLIGIGLEQPAVPMTTFAQKATPSTASKNALIRWFFQPDYDCVMISNDGDAIQFVGGGVKLVGEDELVNRAGERKGSGGMNKASKAYCESFTKVYDKLAAVDPVWAELRNVMDLAVVAAYIQKYELYSLADWKLEVFGDESKLRTEVINAPTHVAPVANAIFKDGALMTPIAGGVAVQPKIALNSDRVRKDIEGSISNAKSETGSKMDQLSEGQWWWD
jgi:hypothetical protein